MFQQHVTATRPAPPRPKWQLAGRQVTQVMYYDAEKAKRTGRRVYFVTAERAQISDLTGPGVDDDCQNCEGFGYMALEIVMGGPFKNAPQGKHGNEDEVPTVYLRPAWHNGAWWQVAREMYPCPVCKADQVQL